MLSRSHNINSEETIFYIDLVTNFIKRKNLVKAIRSFIKEKNKFNSLTSWGVVLFQKDENPICEYDLKETETVIKTITDNWDTREIEKSYLENGLYEILAYIFRKSREARKNYRVIIISDTPSKLADDYYNALYDLLIKAKKFSAFIDIIRVGKEQFYEDDVKLKVISSETFGGMFYCQEEKLLQNILGSLVQNKNEFKVLKSAETEKVLKEDKLFYERLAVDLISLSEEDDEICIICEQELCPICEAHSDEVHKCFNCNAKYHSCCSAKYSIAKNIGFRHLFRCIQCETLLKLDEEYVNMIYKEDLGENLPEIDTSKSLVEKIEEGSKDKVEQKQTEELEEVSLEGEFIEETQDINPEEPPSPLNSETSKKVKVGGFFGKEIEIKIKRDSKPLESTPELSIEQKTPTSITALKPPRKRRVSRIKLCKICGATLQGTITCPMCGAKDNS
ncbi:hypothetical protein LCGC14_0960500 [marine sediment metagenome]|uniref:VWFA domain-containing protein n=1 Tax=marine sediment metagenome TaxID=412755 RepID=A0A0F9NJC2_9ZZZZ|nr:MAG: hypothetical protein Lokiarch_19200 [Candidatus Lokiarchaeum sp. GC14_75]